MLLLGQRLVTENPMVSSSPAEVTWEEVPKVRQYLFIWTSGVQHRYPCQSLVLSAIIFDIDGLLISETPPGRDVDGVRAEGSWWLLCSKPENVRGFPQTETRSTSFLSDTVYG